MTGCICPRCSYTLCTDQQAQHVKIPEPLASIKVAAGGMAAIQHAHRQHRQLQAQTAGCRATRTAAMGRSASDSPKRRRISALAAALPSATSAGP